MPQVIFKMTNCETRILSYEKIENVIEKFPKKYPFLHVAKKKKKKNFLYSLEMTASYFPFEGAASHRTSLRGRRRLACEKKKKNPLISFLSLNYFAEKKNQISLIFKTSSFVIR